MATLGTTSKPAYVYDTETDTWVPIGVGAHTHALTSADVSGVVAQSGYFAAGKNKIINGDFGIWQRGTTLTYTTNAGAYIVDRFLLNFAGTFTGTVSQQIFTSGAAPVSGYEGTYFCRVNRTGTTSVSPTFYQRIENVRTLAGQTVTFSFWAKADTARNVTLNYYQAFGSGGSSAATANVGTASLTTSWQRFSFTFVMPSISGKTVGTDSWTTVYFDLPDSTAFTFDIWGMQLESGSTATAFQTASGSEAGELLLCQRYYTTSIPTGFTVTNFSGMNQGSSSAFGWCSTGSTNDIFTTIQYPVPMRSAPTFVIYSAGNRTAGSVRDAVTGSDIAVGNYSVQSGNNKGFNYMSGFTATAGRAYSFQWTASAEL